ncbi:MAG: ribonuclease HII [Fusobacteriaceae bacterium]|nr:ribonuclease HII [Fusobacteriaceae bacterium]
MAENALYQYDLSKNIPVVGVDEAGRGPLAGPVVAACALLKNYDESLAGINDSKKLGEKKREALYDVILEHFYTGIGLAAVEEIDRMNILNATFLAMRRALSLLSEKQDLSSCLVLVDGNFPIREYVGPQEALVKGDGTSLAIAAASILAKVTRDRIMAQEEKNYPGYGFSKHKGYGTKDHIRAIHALGSCKIHRETFLKGIIKENLRLF